MWRLTTYCLEIIMHCSYPFCQKLVKLRRLLDSFLLLNMKCIIGGANSFLILKSDTLHF